MDLLPKCQNVTEAGLECYYCESDIYGNQCNSNETGTIIKCQMHSSSELHYGDVCAIGHTGKKTNANFIGGTSL